MPNGSMDSDKYVLFIDDTGNREAKMAIGLVEKQDNGMDCFALGGVLIKGEAIDDVQDKHKSFCLDWGIDYPLHSSRIRGARGKFGWLGSRENRDAFLSELQTFILSLPVIAIACVVDREGYSSRYGNIYHNHLWPMSKTVFSILLERAAKFADRHDRRLEVYFEESGKKEDRRLVLRQVRN
ncbi:MAG: hypothetical protein OXN21_13375 [Chloroflexota bacterium]|nr:hypothetical protein [Chloroflexota bacterium]